MSEPYGDEYEENLEDDKELTPMQRQRLHDLEIALYKQGLTLADLENGVDSGAFIDENAYKE